uniref:Uncharacterized protein n=1 Tax=Meloidogyne incognita TaxID=6306 RepID=A0A914MQG2_MELIC
MNNRLHFDSREAFNKVNEDNKKQDTKIKGVEEDNLKQDSKINQTEVKNVEQDEKIEKLNVKFGDEIKKRMELEKKLAALMERVDRKEKKDEIEDEKTRKEIENIKKDMAVIKFDVQLLKNWRATVEKQKEEAREQAQEDKGCGGDGAVILRIKERNMIPKIIQNMRNITKFFSPQKFRKICSVCISVVACLMTELTLIR